MWWWQHLQNLLVTLPFGGSTITITTTTTAVNITYGCTSFSMLTPHNPAPGGISF
jgi:hypothetical protein